MSICVVATYPWKAIESLPGLSAPGVIVCSDTRATSPGQTITWKFSKQRLVARNILVCYTSSHGSATTAAIQAAWGSKSVRRIGDALRKVHSRLGGLTEMIACVWRGSGIPQILELMPPEYRAVQRTGIIGIGDADVLDWFVKNFDEEARGQLAQNPTPEMLAAVERQFGGPVSFPEPEYPIDFAALNVGAALSVGIETAGGPTVGLPIQVMVIHGGGVRQIPVVATRDLKRVHPITIEHHATRLPDPVFPRLAQERRHRRAVQLFL